MATTETQNKALTPKDPDNPKNYGVSVADLKPDGVTLASATVVACEPSGLTVGGSATLPQAATITGDRAAAQFGGGTASTDYLVTFRCVYSDGQAEDISIIIPVRQK